MPAKLSIEYAYGTLAGVTSDADAFDQVAWVTPRSSSRWKSRRRAATKRRGFLVFATNPALHPDAPGYREVYATEAGTPAQAAAKVRPLAGERRLRVYLATGRYSDELADARWVA